MSKLKDLIAYIIANYPKKEDLSNARLTKMLYLADWHQAIHHKSKITNIDWYFDNYGPFVWDVKNEVEKNKDVFCIKKNTDSNGYYQIKFELKSDKYNVNISDSEKESLDHVISISKDLNWNDFIKLVYSTYPITSSRRYTKLDLMSKAAEHKKLYN